MSDRKESKFVLATAFLWIVATCFIASTTASSANDPQTNFTLGVWTGEAHIDQESGAFTSCIASTPSRNGLGFLVLVDHRFQWKIAFVNKGWRFASSEIVPVNLYFDNMTGMQMKAFATKSDFLIIDMPTDAESINRFRRSYTLKARIIGGEYQFPLTHTSRLLPRLADCVKRNMHLAPENSAATESFQTSGSKSPNNQMRAPDPYRMEAIHLASNFILQGDFRNARFLKEAEIAPADISFDAVWEADGAGGAVKLFPPQEGVTGTDIATALASGESASCKGRFASGRASELLDDTIVYRGFASCDDSSGARVAQFYVLPRSDKSFATFIVVSREFLSQDPESVDASIARYQEAAIRVVDTP